MMETGLSRLETAQLNRERADEALWNGNWQAAWDFFHKICLELSGNPDSFETKALFIATTLELSELGFALGKDIYEITVFLSQALERAEGLGDLRSQALINLHLGRLYYFGQRRIEAFHAFEKGNRLVKELGDHDIMVRSAEFLGLNYFTQGLFKEACHHFEIGLEALESGKSNRFANALTPMWIGYCAAFMGQFHHAIGTLEYYRRFCLDRGDHSSAATLRAVLGIILLTAGKNRDAYYHLVGAEKEGDTYDNAMALYFARGGLVYHMFQEGKVRESYDLIIKMHQDAQEAGINRQYVSPIFLELAYEFYRLGYKSIFGIGYQSEVVQIMREPNIFLRGVALRLRAMDNLANEGDIESVKRDLEQSKEYLTKSNAAIQLARTLIEMARLALKEGNKEKAHAFANKAFKELGGYKKEFYPDDLQYLLRPQSEPEVGKHVNEELLTQFMDIIQELEPSTDFNTILLRVIKATNRLIGAERGGIFWFGKNEKKSPTLRAAHNLAQSSLEDEDFRSNMALVFEAYRTGEPRMAKEGMDSGKHWPYQGKAVLCLPFRVDGTIVGVIYYDNSYVDGCFDVLEIHSMNSMAQRISQFIERLYSSTLKLREMSVPHVVQATPADYNEIITQSRAMINILEKADLAAATDSTVLILGETGVGKELLARRIHDKSNRSDKSLIIVNPSTMPESLAESELFGHEKGAFTGADRQKKGPLELAHSGTLFIDEIGDIPLGIQVKLLRVLQQKTIMRVGGTKIIHSDFRLVAATNRNLAQMVADGAFREDLYYRINVVPICIPPLRERPEDVLLLARHFLQRYVSRYHHTESHLTSEDVDRLKTYHWPGNIRELQNVMERTSLLSTGGKLELNFSGTESTLANHPFADMPTMDELQKQYIMHVLGRTNGKLSGPDGAAEILGMKRSTLYNRMKKLRINNYT